MYSAYMLYTVEIPKSRGWKCTEIESFREKNKSKLKLKGKETTVV